MFVDKVTTVTGTIFKITDDRKSSVKRSAGAVRRESAKNTALDGDSGRSVEITYSEKEMMRVCGTERKRERAAYIFTRYIYKNKSL